MNTRPVVLITGASRGIGRASAKIFAENGYRVCINYRSDKASALSLEQELNAKESVALAVQADISNEQDIVNLFNRVDEHFGQLDVLVNNAGTIAPQAKIESFTAQRMTRLFNTNITGLLLCCREAVKRMGPKKQGCIVNISSIAARIGAPNEYIDYAASKGAVDSITRGLAIEVADRNIRVNGVRPGLIYTDIHAGSGEPGRVDRLKSKVPLGRGGKPEEVAEVIYFLASDKSSYISGATIDVGGGR